MRPTAKMVIWVTVALCGAGLALAGPKEEPQKKGKKKGPPPPPAVRVERIDVPGHLALPLAESIRMVLGRRVDRQSVIVAADPAAGCVLVSGPPKLIKALRSVMGPGPYEPPEAGGPPPPERPERTAERRRRAGVPDEVRIVHLGSSSSKWAAKSLHEAFAGEAGLRIASNAERNAVILKGSPDLVRAAERVLLALDDGGGRTGDGAPIHVIPLKHCRAGNVAPIVDHFFAGQAVQVGYDPRTEAIIVRCDEPTLEQVRSLIAKIDVRTEPQRGRQVAKPHPERRSERKTEGPKPAKKKGKPGADRQKPSARPGEKKTSS